MIVYSNAMLRICRRFGITRAEAVRKYGDRLEHVQCNVVTTASLERIVK